MSELTIDMLLYAYARGIFPMADDRNGEIHWYSADPRAIIPLETYRPQRSLRPILNKNIFEIRINTCFEEVMRHCAAPRVSDVNTWISEQMIQVYTQLHKNGYAHSVEAWYDGQLAGGLYGVALGGAFFGESMFTLRSNASKVAFHYLVQHLIKQGFVLLDTQFINDNVLRYGAVEIPATEYHQQLEIALAQSVSFV
ncbi:leucyl/phenylalanyl-tRNA--protein transferase [Cytophagaceae bacterium DM2B3-1]|uniref:Leucyl/phenylalanyl-tRNA--protein transferase n=1 Tax=Xanthocytophaga flava TaxID=3048013 RepID=A0AAE3QRR5_9BACT|nr:leucyl/phenylalanyl-tRNA--protein transferase [Xanthocytophaga flavus]MDJ1481629.1 leucyl/phenylalanyl-tRNA--protein transferase [Xanthocytophaga flavus]MDJ1491592.1 leucyl/phenylalanyl-tRNA--protein transferase [Xanthocytophaga flavus]